MSERNKLLNVKARASVFNGYGYGYKDNKMPYFTAIMLRIGGYCVSVA